MVLHLVGLLSVVGLALFTLAALTIHTPWQWWLKALIIAATAIVLIGCYLSLVRMLGWPSPLVDIEEPMELLHAVVEQPDKRDGSKGAIYLWVRSPESAVPRALQLPYSGESHAELERAQTRMRQGVSQGIQTRSGSTPGVAGSFRAHDLVKPKPPPKE